MKLLKIHNWLQIENNLLIAGFYLSIMLAVLGGAWKVFTHFYPISSDKSLHNSNTLTNNTFNNSPIKIEQNIVSGYSIDLHQKILREELASLRKDLERAHGAEINLIKVKLSVVEEKLLYLQKSYEDRIKEIQELNLAIEEFKGKNLKIATQQFIDAQTELEKGEDNKADALFEDIENDSEEIVAIAAKAAYQRAKIANNSFRWKDALKLANKATRLQQKNEMYLSFYADILLKTGNELEAQKIYKQSLDLTINRYGSDSINAAEQHNRLALAYLSNNFIASKKHFLEAIRIAQKAPAKNFLYLGNFHSNLASLLQKNGQYPDAERSHLNAIKIHEKYLAKNHPDLAFDYNNIGGLYDLQNKHDMAVKYFLKAINIEENLTPPNHTSLPKHYYNLASVYLTQHTPAKAKPLLLKAADIYEKYPPANSEEIIGTYALLASTLFDLKDYESAEPYYKFLVEKLMNRYGSGHMLTKGFLREYILCLKNQGKDISPVLSKYNLRVAPSVK